MGIPADASIWIVEQPRRILDDRAVAEWWRPGVDVVVLAGHEVVPHGIRRTQSETAVAANVPRHAAARREIPPLLVQAGLPLRETGIAGIGQTRGRVVEDSALDPLLKVLDVLAEVRLPAHAVVDRHAARETPRILRIRADVPVVDEQQVLAAVLEGRHAADEEIREAEAGD